MNQIFLDQLLDFVIEEIREAEKGECYEKSPNMQKIFSFGNEDKISPTNKNFENINSQ